MAVIGALLAETRRYDFAHLPFVEAVRQGRCPRPSLQRYCADLAVMAENFPQHLAMVLTWCDVASIRQAVLANLLEEEGVTDFGPARGLTAPAGANHGVLAWRLANALGVSRDAGRARRSHWVERQHERRRWLGPLAFYTVGFEANVPAVFGPLADGLRRHYGLSDDDVAFLTLHVDADKEHGEAGIEMIARYATTPAAEHEALEGARRGCLTWYAVHRQHERAMAQPVGG